MTGDRALVAPGAGRGDGRLPRPEVADEGRHRLMVGAGLGSTRIEPAAQDGHGGMIGRRACPPRHGAIGGSGRDDNGTARPVEAAAIVTAPMARTAPTPMPSTVSVPPSQPLAVAPGGTVMMSVTGTRS